MAHREDDMADLDGLLSLARTDGPLPSAGLTARILADADALQPRAGTQVAAAPRARGGFWPALVSLFGGGGALAGMGSAMAAGLVLGFYQPAPVASLTAAIGLGASIESVDLMPGVDGLLAEE